jgi:hypothetical protein
VGRDQQLLGGDLVVEGDAEIVPGRRPDTGERGDTAGLVDAVLDPVLGDVVLGAPAGDGLVLGRVVQGVSRTAGWSLRFLQV